MITFIKKYRKGLLPIVAAALLFASCNKDVNQYNIPAAPASTSNISIDSILRANPDDSLFYKLILRANANPNGVNFSNILKNTAVSNQYTVFAVDNNGMKIFINAASGGAILLNSPDAVFVGFINSSLPTSSAAGIVGYNIIPQKYDTASISSNFPNMPVGTLVQIAPTTAPWLTLVTFPSKRSGGILRVNTIPMTSPLNVQALNGIIHHLATVAVPPSTTTLWDRISTDAANSTGLTYLQAAVRRADSATNANGTGGAGTLEAALRNPVANLTVFAPIDAVFQGTLSALLTQFLMAQGNSSAVASARANNAASTPGVFDSVAYRGFLTAKTISGILVYHILTNRAFTVNFPIIATKYPTLLNTVAGLTAHPGLELQATFSGAFVSAATVKGTVNTTPANLSINPSPAPNGSSDQFYINGVLHKINQVLFPATP